VFILTDKEIEERLNALTGEAGWLEKCIHVSVSKFPYVECIGPRERHDEMLGACLANWKFLHERGGQKE